MSLRAEEADEAEWAAALTACPWATFFQNPLWAQATRTLRPEDRLRVVRLTFPTRSVIFPFYERRRGWLRPRIERRGNKAGVYGGWVGAEALSPVEAREALAWFAAGSRDARIRPNPFHGPLPDPAGLGFQVLEEGTSLLDPRLGTAALLAGYASGQRRNLRAAEKAGVQVRQAGGPADWTAYLALYAETLERRGDEATGRYPDAFLRELGALPVKHCRLWLAEVDGGLGAGVIAFYQGSHVVLWHSANSAAMMQHYPFKLLVHRILEDAVDRGLGTFDLNPSRGLEGPAQWKRMLGAHDVPAPVLWRHPGAWSRGSAGSG